MAGRTYQGIIIALEQYWARYGCVILTPYHTEVAAGTMNPATLLRSLGPKPWKTAYIEPVIRPLDGRYGENPMRFQHYFQYQVLLKPSPDDVLDLYLASLRAMGLDTDKHDIRFVEDDWEQPTVGAWGLGWEVWADGMEITQFTYFQQVAGMELDLIPAEITYGLDRLAMVIQDKPTVFDLDWAEGITWRDVFQENERQFSHYNFEEADVGMLMRHFEDYEREARRLIERRLPLPAYDVILKANHAFNLLDARGAISVTERAAYIGRVRNLVRADAQMFLELEEERAAAPV
jgi:glycyl-tRNA synthetase alpha chain